MIPLVLIAFEIRPTADRSFQIKQTNKQIPSITESADLNAQAFILTDSQTGQIIYEKNIQQSLPIASISKIIPVYLIYQALKEGKIKLTDQVKIRPEIADLSTVSGLSNVKLNANSTYSVEDLLYATLLSSANAGVMALSEHLAPLDQINQAEQDFLKSLKIEDFLIVNVNGLPNDMLGSLRNPGTAVDADNKMSASAVSQVAAKLVTDFPAVLDVSKNSTYKFKAGTAEAQDLKSTNQLLPGGNFADPKLEVVGLKTGTNDDGYSFVATLKKDQRLMTAVILNAPSDQARFGQTRDFLRRFQQNYHLITINSDTNPNVKKAANLFKNQYDLKSVESKDLTLWVPNEVKAEDFHFKLEFDRAYFQQTKKPGLTLTLDLPENSAKFMTDSPLVLNLR
ncbi:cytochrome c553 [Xylocopilactobacillus apicola]|uniref:Cytochrome c553 n=1 Tax=Xylocopilactobacillus apicola TaxID=2932184 RepID=A0AAU9D687_9LACO|nr:cytochrome c553 [Xylocopilactobacillus apicola]